MHSRRNVKTRMPRKMWLDNIKYYGIISVHRSKNQIDSSFFTYFGVISLKRMRLHPDPSDGIWVKSQTTNA